jgi:hypothetical protein
MTRHFLSAVAFDRARASVGNAFCTSFQAKEISSNHCSLKYGSKRTDVLSLMSVFWQMLYKYAIIKKPALGGYYGSQR